MSTTQSIPIAKITESPSNPRKTYRHLEELAESIKAHGILQPIVARKHGTNGSARYEIVFGHRRFRAAKLAGLEELDVDVRELDDAKVSELQLVENVQRDDVDALEEAEGYERLQKDHGYSVDDIAAKVGKTKATIYARLKLCALIPEARKALADGILTPSTALLVARVPATLQAEAVKQLTPQDFRGEGEPDPVGAREALRHIQANFMLRLDQAPFDPADAQLVATAGACGACPKRTGNQPELFADVQSKDTCTDPTCFREKSDAAWEVRKVAAKAAGVTIVEGKKAKELLPYGDRPAYGAGLVNLDTTTYGPTGGGKPKSYRERYKKEIEAAAPAVTLVRTVDGKVHELVDEKLIKRIEAKARPKTEPDEKEKGMTPAERGRLAAEKLVRDAKHAAARVAQAAIVARAEKVDFDKNVWRALVKFQRDMTYGDDENVFERRGVEHKDIDKTVEAMNVAQLRALFLDLVLETDAEFPAEEGVVANLADAQKIDMKQLVAKELARLKTEAKKPPPPKEEEQASKPKSKPASAPKKNAKKKAGKK